MSLDRIWIRQNKSRVLLAGSPTIPVTPESAYEMSSSNVTVGYFPGYESLNGIVPPLNTTLNPGNITNAKIIWLNDTQSGSPGANDRPLTAQSAIETLYPLVSSNKIAEDAIVNLNCESPHHNDLVSAMAYNATSTQMSNWIASRDSWIAVLQGVKTAFPKMKVGIWGLPYVPASPAQMFEDAPVGSWMIPFLIGQGVYPNEQARLENEEAYIQEMINRLEPVIAVSDYINGRVYPNYGYRSDNEKEGALLWPPVYSATDYGRSRDKAFLNAVLRIGSGLKQKTNKPHYACIKPSWTSHDTRAAYWKDELIPNTIWNSIINDICLHGIDGIYVWWSYRLLDYAFSTTPGVIEQASGFTPVSQREIFRLSWIDERGETPSVNIEDESYWTNPIKKQEAFELVSNKIKDRMIQTAQITDSYFQNNPIQLDSIWIRDQGAARKISDVWVRNSGGVAEKTYPNSSEEENETTLLIMNQSVSQQLCSIRFDQEHPNPFTSWSVGIETEYRKLGIEFGINSGLGDGLVSNIFNGVQASFAPVIPAFNSGYSQNGSNTYPFQWDWLSLNIEGAPTVQGIVRGGKNSNDIIPTNYSEFKRTPSVPTNPNNIQTMLNTIQYYYPSATSDTITYGQWYDSCVRGNLDSVAWLREQCPTAKVMNWWKASVNPIPLIGNGWWNHPSVGLDGDGTPPGGFDTIYKQSAAGLRTIEGNNAWKPIGDGTTWEEGNNAWTYGLTQYPLGTSQARGHAVAFEKAINSKDLKTNTDAVIYQSYFAIYPKDRTLNTIPHNEYENIPFRDFTHAFVNDGSRYLRWNDSFTAIKKASRLSWLANWKEFGNKASIGTELVMDLGGFTANRFNGLATDNSDYIEVYVKPVLERVTEEEAQTYGLPSSVIGKRLIPRYWTFWNAGWYYLWLLTDSLDNNGNRLYGRANFRRTINGVTDPTFPPLLRSRSNIEWRFAGIPGSPPIDWLEGSQWHGFICRKLDEFGLQRCQLVKEAIEVARNNP